MILLRLLTIALTLALGWLVARRWAPGSSRWSLQLVLAGCPILGISSLWGMVETFFGGTRLVSLWTVECILQALAVGWLCALPRRSPSPDVIALPKTKAARLMELCFWFSFLVSSLGIASYFLQNPHGGWDAWSIWNLRARFLFRAGSAWQIAFSPLLASSHPDYPLLLPSVIVHLWRLIGRETPAVPAALATGFILGTAVLLKEAVSRFRGPVQGALAGLVLLGTSSYLHVGLDQIADVPVAYFLLSAVLVLVQSGFQESPENWLWLGLSLGLAAWTKNEGLVLAGVLLAARGSLFPKSKKWLAYFFAGAALPLAGWVWFKLRVAPPNDLLQASHLLRIEDCLLSGARWRFIFVSFAQEFWRFGHHVIPAMLCYALIAQAVAVRQLIDGRWFLGFLAAMLGIYFLIFLITPYDLSWHVHSALTRLIVQLWPATLFAVMVGRAPTES